MKNLELIELNTNELKYICGGAPLSFRIGQFIRLAFMSQGTLGNLNAAINEFAVNEVLSD
tara:strand:- start:67227 stop:67406 length:180 start_codon:yes stop_codon:yes gene_type:complete